MNNLNLKNILLFSLIAAFFSMNTASPMTPARRGYHKKELAPFKPELPLSLKLVLVYNLPDFSLNIPRTDDRIINLLHIIDDNSKPLYIKMECLDVFRDAKKILSSYSGCDKIEAERILQRAIKHAEDAIAIMAAR